MTELGAGKTNDVASNDLLLPLTLRRLQHTFTYGTIAQTAADVQDIQNSPAISIGPYLILSEQTGLLRFISIYSQRGKSLECLRFLYMNAVALSVWRAMGKGTHIIEVQERPPRTAQLMYGVPFSR